jgi:AhpD family alkylhydroperoxidase
MIVFPSAPIRSKTPVKFPRRTYGSWTEPLKDMAFLARHLRLIISTSRKRVLSAAFQQRLMLAVTAVNQCRYCSWVHTRQALQSGLSGEEVRSLLSGNLEDCPEEEALALLYAQHWAEANATPDREWVGRLVDTYGTQKAQAIDVVLRMIRVGNLMGNSWDYLLYRVSFGRWGV